MTIRCPNCSNIQPASEFCANCGVRFDNSDAKKAWYWKPLIFALLFCAAVIALSIFTDRNGNRSANVSAPTARQKVDEKASVMPQIQLSVIPTTGGFGTVMLGNVTIANNSTRTIKDVVVSCDAFGGSGTKINTLKETIYETFNPKTTKTVKELNFGFIDQQVKSVRCTITDFVF